MRHYLKWGSYLVVLLHITASCDVGELSHNRAEPSNLAPPLPTSEHATPTSPSQVEPPPLNPEHRAESDTVPNESDESSTPPTSPEEAEPSAHTCDSIECGHGGFCYEFNNAPLCDCPQGYHPDSRASGLLCADDTTLESCGPSSANCIDPTENPVPESALATCVQHSNGETQEYGCSFQCEPGLEARFALEQWLCSEATEQNGNERFLNHELLIKPADNISSQELLSGLEQIGASIEEPESLVTRELGYLKLSLPHEVEAIASMSFLLESGLIDSAFPNHTTTATATLPNDPRWGQAWNMESISAPAAWDVTTSTGDVIVAVLDSGFDPYHSDLSANVWHNTAEVPSNGIDDDDNGKIDDTFGWDTLDNDNFPLDAFDSHGTRTAGVIGATGNNAQGLTGVAWTTQMMNLRVLSYNRGDAFSLTEALLYAAANGAQIINLSLTVDGHSPLMLEALESLETQGIIVVAAAGNDGVNIDFFPSYPSAYELSNLVSVAASNSDDTLLSTSNSGTLSVDLTAPGEHVPTTGLGNSYLTSTGTSTAAPHVAGALALYRALQPELPPSLIIRRLLGTIDPIETLSTSVKSGGRLNMGRLISLSPCPEEHFGYDCAPCTCMHGTCDDGLEGSGECSECNEGWAGTDCTRCASDFFGTLDETTSCILAFSGQANISERDLASACSCTPCMCENGQCSDGLTGHGGCLGCDTSFHLLNPIPPSSCVSNETITSCTTLGIDCITTAPDLTTPSCTGSQCLYTCVEGSHDDQGVCTNDSTLTSCGPAGINCNTTQSPAHTVASCDGTTCSWDCSAGYQEVTLEGERTCRFAEGRACSHNDECAGTCAQGLCATVSHTGNPCDEDDVNDCASELSCISGYCLGNNSKSCSTNDECANTCIQAICADPSIAGGACDGEDSEDCTTGYLCESSQCISTATCGDGIWVTGAEGCDDGNTASEDGCSELCEIEPGFACIGNESLVASCRPCTFYVDSGATADTQSATSWSEAASSLDAIMTLAQTFLEDASSNCRAIEIWIHSGSYQPDTIAISSPNASANPSFPDGFQIYGGFEGSESSRSQRELGAQVTLLTPSTPGRLFNIEGVPFPITLDGMSIEDGSGYESDGIGGAIRCENSVLTLRNLRLTNNQAIDGGALGSINCQIELSDTHFVRNQATLGGSGGALYARGGSIDASRVYVQGNQAVSYGGGLFLSYLSNVTLSNIVVTGNQAQIGAGLSLWSIPLTTLTHLSMVENNATNIADSIYAFGSEIGIANSVILDPSDLASILSASSSSLASSCVQSLNGVTNSTDVITDCELVFELTPNPGADLSWGTEDDEYGNLRTPANQPTVDAGNTSITSELEISTDASSANRLCGAGVDMGAYESQDACSE